MSLRLYFLAIMAVPALVAFPGGLPPVESESQVEGGKGRGPYLGQSPPGTVAEMFAPGVISTGHDNLMVVFPRGGKEACFVLGGAPHSVTACMEEEEGAWTEPEVASFSGSYGAEVTLSPDGSRILFSSGLPASGSGPPSRNWQVWSVEREGAGWGEPERLEYPVNSDSASADYPTVTTDSTLFFYSGNRTGGLGRGDIWYSAWEDGRYDAPRNIGAPVNSEFWDIDPFVAPDGRLLLFASDRPGGFGGLDLYASRRQTDGSWTEPVNLGEGVNSSANEVHPMFSLDGKYLFFTSSRALNQRYSQEPLTLAEKIRLLEQPLNGSENIYWVDASVVPSPGDQAEADAPSRTWIADGHTHDLVERGEDHPPQGRLKDIVAHGVGGVILSLPLDLSAPEDLIRQVEADKERVARSANREGIPIEFRTGFSPAPSSAGMIAPLQILISLESPGGVFSGVDGSLGDLRAMGVSSITMFDNSYDRISTREEGRLVLSERGRKVVEEMNALGMVPDITHLPTPLQLEVIAHSRQPVIASHSNVRAVAGAARNLPDTVLSELTGRGGLVLLTFDEEYLFGVMAPEGVNGVKKLVDHVDYLVREFGIDHVGLGSDFGGSGRSAPADLMHVACFREIREALEERGYTSGDLSRIMGGNLIAFFGENR